jgi:hypothetical protein
MRNCWHLFSGFDIHEISKKKKLDNKEEDIRKKGETKNKEKGKKEKDQKMEGKRNPILLFLPLR